MYPTDFPVCCYVYAFQLLHVTGSLSTELVSIIIREGSKLRYYNATPSQPYNAINFLVRSYWQELVNSSLQVLQ